MTQVIEQEARRGFVYGDSKRLHRLEALRGLAATYVVAHHALPHDWHLLGLPLGIFLRFGQEAVILFFLLSGFVIHFSFSVRPTSSAIYLFSRFSRIYLPLFPILLLAYISDSISSGAFADLDLRTLLGNLLMLQDISGLKPGVIVEPYKNNLPLWSLSYEWWFYVIYIAMMRIIQKRNLQTGAVLLAGVACSVLYYWHPIWLLRLGFYLVIWWAGALMADAYLIDDCRRVPPQSFPSVFLPILTIALVLAVCAWRFGAFRSSTLLGTYPILELRHFGAALFLYLQLIYGSNPAGVASLFLCLLSRLWHPFLMQCT
jgi:peptidoglycan/LPS O-acetylase OafA/YrhL